MATEARSKKGFYAVYCCDNYLCDAPANTSVMCFKCGRWKHIEGDKNNKLEGDQVAAGS